MRSIHSPNPACAVDSAAGLLLHPATTGREVFTGLLTLAQTTIEMIPEGCSALTGRVRGAGPGVSFREQIAVLERDHPVELVFPFEGSNHVGGAAWRAADLLTPPLLPDHAPRLSPSLLPRSAAAGIAKLHWRAGADDLPMHSHPTSDRVIVVLEGRGFFHASGQPLDRFDGTDVRTIAARSGDVFVFRRGTVHTFSTADHGMTLISCHLPFLELDDPAQYALPSVRWTAGEDNAATPPLMRVGGWQALA